MAVCNHLKLDWIEQCFTSPPTQYRLYGRREQPPKAARRRTDRTPHPEATSRLPQNFDVEGERNHGSDGDEAQTPPANRSQYGPRDVNRTPSASSPDRRPSTGTTTTTTGSGEEDSSQRHHHRRSSPQPPISPNRGLATGPRQPVAAAAPPPFRVA